MSSLLQVFFFRRSIGIDRIDSEPVPESPKVDSDTMLAFYQRLFPFRYLFQWLNHGVMPSPDFGNREFALTLQNDAYLRYQSYTSAELYVTKDSYGTNNMNKLTRPDSAKTSSKSTQPASKSAPSTAQTRATAKPSEADR